MPVTAWWFNCELKGDIGVHVRCPFAEGSLLEGMKCVHLPPDFTGLEKLSSLGDFEEWSTVWWWGGVG